MIEQGGKVSGYGKGFYPGRGPGTQSSASYGGKLASSSKPCYGSIFEPVSLGSGGGADHSAQAGGRIRLQVGGTLTVEGEIDADGKVCGYYNSSGGSIWIDCGTLSGAGSVHADGANRTGAYDAGCGGRVAVYQTSATDFTAFTGKITAYGGTDANVTGAYPDRPAGTVYLQSAGMKDHCGTVKIDNSRWDFNSYSTGGVDLPVTVQCSDEARWYRDTAFALSRGGILALTGDVMIDDLSLDAYSRVNLNGWTLTIRSRNHRKGKGWPSNWATAIVYPGSRADTETGDTITGQIIWEKTGTMLFLR